MVNERILTNASDDELAYAVEENLYDLFRTMVRNLEGSTIEETELLCRHLSFPTNPMFKGVWKTRLNEDNVDEYIAETIAWFQERDAPYFFWWTGATTRPDDLGLRLMERGMLSMEAQMETLAPGIKSTSVGAPCMLANLDAMNEEAVTQVPSGFEIEKVQDEASLYEFKQVFIDSYEIPEWAAQAWVDATLHIGFNQLPWTLYIGRLHGKPVAINILFLGGGVASVYGVATLPIARGRGIGGAITLAPLLEARDMGYKYAVLFATDMGIRSYERIGFRLNPARLNRYLWRISS